MKFKTWKEQYLFVKEYANACCFDCRYGGEIKETTGKDSDYVRTFCSKFISMVDFQFQFPLCAEWENKDGQMLNDISDDDTTIFRIDDDLLDSLDTDYEWTFEELKERINNHEEIKE